MTEVLTQMVEYPRHKSLVRDYCASWKDLVKEQRPKDFRFFLTKTLVSRSLPFFKI